MRKRVLQLGTKFRDKATEQEGTITHWLCDMGGRIFYLFQPNGLNEEGQPLQKIYLCEERLNVSDSNFEVVDIPFEILGTTVTDKASGFTGMAIEFVRHINGCFHIVIQPAGRLLEKNTPIKANDFDLRGCTGEKILQLTEKEHRDSLVEKPSPAEGSFAREITVKQESVMR